MQGQIQELFEELDLVVVIARDIRIGIDQHRGHVTLFGGGEFALMVPHEHHFRTAQLQGLECAVKYPVIGFLAADLRAVNEALPRRGFESLRAQPAQLVRGLRHAVRDHAEHEAPCLEQRQRLFDGGVERDIRFGFVQH